MKKSSKILMSEICDISDSAPLQIADSAAYESKNEYRNLKMSFPDLIKSSFLNRNLSVL
jgi:hypothetical protein